MTVIPSWLRSAGQAANLVSGRAELWLPGAIAALAYLGWLPLVLAVSPFPRTSDLVFLGTGLVSSSIFPLNVLMIGAVIAAVVLLACAAAAFGEAAVQRGIAEEPSSGALRDTAASVYAIILVVAMPVAIVLAALAIRLAGIAPDAVTTPDIGGSLAVRLASALLPFLVALAVVLLFAQALGVAAMRRASGSDRSRPGAALWNGLGDLLRRPGRRLAIAFAIALVDLVAFVLTMWLLRTLWTPIGQDLARGLLASPLTVVLLAGFVMVWLVLVIAAGALHAWGSAWWSLELAQPGDESRA